MWARHTGKSQRHGPDRHLEIVPSASKCLTSPNAVLFTSFMGIRPTLQLDYRQQTPQVKNKSKYPWQALMEPTVHQKGDSHISIQA